MALQPEQAESALPWIRQALDLDIRDLEAHLLEARALMQDGESRTAASNLRKLIRKDPNNPAAHNLLGLCFLAQKEYPDAMAAFREAIDLDPGYGDAFLNLTRALKESQPENREKIRVNDQTALALGSQPDPVMNIFLNEGVND